MRITVDQDSDLVTTTLRLAGRLADAWVFECSRAWQALAPNLSSRQLCVDLRDVTFVDQSGAQLLAEIYQKHHAQFLANTPLTKYYAEQAVGDHQDAVSAKAKTADGLKKCAQRRPN